MTSDRPSPDTLHHSADAKRRQSEPGPSYEERTRAAEEAAELVAVTLRTHARTTAPEN